MKKGDKVIIAGVSGYEIGFVTYVNQVLYVQNVSVLIQSGALFGVVVSTDADNLHLYEDRMIDILTEKHGVEKRFSEAF